MVISAPPKPTVSPGHRLNGVLRKRHHRTIFWCATLATTLVAVLMAGVLLGPVTIPLSSLSPVLAHHLNGAPLPHNAASHDAIIWDIRIPRVILGATIGAGLAVAGVVLQALVRNMLADPYVMGVNSGASCGAAASLLFGIGAGFGEYALQASAFLGALAASALVFFIAHTAGRLTTIRLLMAGISVGYALSAATSFLIFASDSPEGSRSVMFWLLGSLGLASWGGPLAVTVIIVTSVTALLMLWGRRLDVLTIGDDTALSLGVHPERFRAVLLALACLLVGVMVAMAGSIGFIGLVVPHLARRLVGGTHAAVLPVAALLGAILLVVADLASRILLAPQEIPIGIITALIGAPFLLVLVRRMRSTPTSS